MTSNIQSKFSQTDQKAINLLGSGLPASVVANAVGLTESRISQLMAQEDFANAVLKLKYDNLNKHNELDAQYDKMEKAAADRLNEIIPMITRPGELLKATQVLNSMKRRGISSPDQITAQNQVVQLTMPTVIVQKFTTNINNQVISAGTQTLQTIQGSALLAAAKNKQDGLHNQSINYTQTKELTNESSNQSINNIQTTTRTKGEAAISEQTKGFGTAAIYKPAI